MVIPPNCTDTDVRNSYQHYNCCSMPFLPMENIHLDALPVPCLQKGKGHGAPDNYRKITVIPCIGNLFKSILKIDSHLKTKYVMIMIGLPIKLVLKATLKLRTIHSYCVASQINKGVSPSLCVHALSISQNHLTTLI